MMRFVLGALRVATSPVTPRKIADAVMDGRSINKDDPKVAQMIRKSVIVCMWKLKQRELVREVAIEGQLKGWVRA